jgi:DNA-binding transcriptional MerR regulator
MRRGLTISEGGKAGGKSRTALLYYHRLGAGRGAGRSEGNYRWYTQREVERVKQICLYRRMGLPLKEIGRLLDQAGGNGKTEGILRRRLETLAEEAEALRRQEGEIMRLLEQMAVKTHVPKARARAKERAGSCVSFLENIMVSKKRWVEIMEAAGFGDAEKKRWHASFEKMEPEGHREFLESLGMSKEEVEKVRGWSRAG